MNSFLPYEHFSEVDVTCLRVYVQAHFREWGSGGTWAGLCVESWAVRENKELASRMRG